jgi:divalent metal cation (Fe/Co/Zn/Cd) transporter
MNGHRDPHDHPHDHSAGHGHTHGIVDPSITTNDRGLWAIKWSFVGLAATAILQLVVVFLSGSVALLADTIHNFGDAATAIPLGIAFWFARKKPSQRFTFGYGRGPSRM